MRIKSFKRRRDSIIKSPEERERKQIPWGKYFYLGILCLIAIFCLNWGYKKVLYVQGVGVLEAETTNIEATLTARIIDIKCAVNDRVSLGSGLILLDTSELQYKIAARERELKERKNVFNQNILALEDELKVLVQEKINWQEEASDFNKEYIRGKDLLALEAITRPQLLDIEYNLKSAERELSVLSTKVVLAERKLEILKKEYEDLLKKAEGETRQLYDLLKENVLFAPRDGIVTVVYKQIGEIAQIGDPVIKIADTSENFIKVFFDPSVEDDIKLGDVVKIVFENGDKTKGKIERIYPATLPLSKEYRTKFGMRERFIIAEVVPLEERSWSRTLRTKAKVYMRRNWL